MSKKPNVICKYFFCLSVFLFLSSLIHFGTAALRAFPSKIPVVSDSFETIRMGPLSISVEDIAIPVYAGDSARSEICPLSSVLSVQLFGIPVKTARVDVLADVEVVPLGLTAGIRIDTAGLMVLFTGAVTAQDGTAARPSEGLLKRGDIIVKIDGIEAADNRQFTAYLDSLEENSTVRLEVRRGAETLTIPVKTYADEKGRNKLGLWVRDSTKGIGTITYYNPENSRFAALGHGITDVDTKQLISVKEGLLHQTDVVAVKKGKSGNPGELVGEVSRDMAIGVVTENTAVGLFGTINTDPSLPAVTMPISLQTDVTEGPAVILSNVGGSEVRQYDIFIERVNRFTASPGKGMVIRVTDPDLLTRTNGIVQGMSGSPIIQNGRLIGAITHVFLQNPQRGYGIFIENMIREERAVNNE